MGRLSDEDKVKETIRFNIERFRLATVTVLTIGAGTVSMINEGNVNGTKTFFIATGIILIVASIILGTRYFKSIKRHIK
ncbi:MAG: hypothetical protein WDO15_22610 [Bacteroidota bacterium]